MNATLLSYTGWLEEVDSPITDENYLSFLTLLRARRKGDGALPPLISSYVDMHYGHRCKRTSLPTVSTFLNLAAFQGVAIQDILCEPAFAASAHIAQGAVRFDGLLFRRRDLQKAQRRIVYIIDKLAADSSPVPPASVVWREVGLWCDGVRDYCPFEHSLFKSKFHDQARFTSLERFRRGATACMRLLQKLDAAVDREALLREHLLTNHGLDQLAAAQCAEACVKLKMAADQSLNETELLSFESQRADRVSQWAAGIEPDDPGQQRGGKEA